MEFRFTNTYGALLILNDETRIRLFETSGRFDLEEFLKAFSEHDGIDVEEPA